MIIRVSKDLESGSWGDDGKFTGEVTYAVITDSSDGLSLFSNKESLKQAKLPIKGDIYLSSNTNGIVGVADGVTLYVQNISFSRREERNFKNNGHLSEQGTGSYAIWDYVVTVTSDPSYGSNGGGGGSGSDRSETPTTMGISPKFYEVYDERCYNPGDLIDFPTGIVLDCAGVPMSGSRQIMNVVLNFTYTTRSFRMGYLSSLLYTVNSEPIQVCGINIPIYCGKITNLSASKNESTNDFSVSCEIEIAVQKSLYKEALISKGFYANLKGTNGVEVSHVRVQQAPSLAEAELWNSESAVTEGRVPGQYKHSVYGNWGSLHNDSAVEDPVIHDPDGFPFIIDYENSDKEEPFLGLDFMNIGLVSKQVSVSASWKPLSFPVRGFKD